MILTFAIKYPDSLKKHSVQLKAEIKSCNDKCRLHEQIDDARKRLKVSGIDPTLS